MQDIGGEILEEIGEVFLQSTNIGTLVAIFVERYISFMEDDLTIL